MELLKGKKGIIFGALDNRSIAWQVALKAKNHGAEFVLSNTSIALRLGSLEELSELCDASIVPADATSPKDLIELFSKATVLLNGKIDFILHSIAMSPNIRKGISYVDSDYSFFNKTIDISALSFHKILQIADSTDSLNSWSSILALSYIAAQRAFPYYGDMADAKAMLESIARNFGYYLGKKNKTRVNTISQSPILTTAGSGVPGIDKFIKYAEKLSPLGNATAEECANYAIFLFSDLSKKITMQNLMHDGGFSSVGMCEEILEDIR